MATVTISKASMIVNGPEDRLLVCHRDAEGFLERFQNTRIATAGINHNLVQIATALTSPNELHIPPFFFWTLEEQGRVIGAAIYADPDGLVVSKVRPVWLRMLADDLLKKIPSPSRIIADPAVAETLVDCTSNSSGIKMAASTGWHVAQLDIVERPKIPARGCLRRASESDRDLVVSWGANYEKEKSAFLNVAKFMSAKLTAGDLYIWEDDDPTTIVTVSGRNEFGARISSVYTPPRHRGYGYASSAVAAVCDKLLESGCGYIVLTWRIGDPAGRMYQRLGFRVIGAQQSYVPT